MITKASQKTRPSTVSHSQTTLKTQPKTNEKKKTRAAFTYHFMDQTKTLHSEISKLTTKPDLPTNNVSKRLRLANTVDTMVNTLASSRDHAPVYNPTCPKCKLVEQHLLLAISLSDPNLLEPTVRMSPS